MFKRSTRRRALAVLGAVLDAIMYVIEAVRDPLGPDPDYKYVEERRHPTCPLCASPVSDHPHVHTSGDPYEPSLVIWPTTQGSLLVTDLDGDNPEIWSS